MNRHKAVTNLRTMRRLTNRHRSLKQFRHFQKTSNKLYSKPRTLFSGKWKRKLISGQLNVRNLRRRRLPSVLRPKIYYKHSLKKYNSFYWEKTKKNSTIDKQLSVYRYNNRILSTNLAKMKKIFSRRILSKKRRSSRLFRIKHPQIIKRIANRKLNLNKKKKNNWFKRNKNKKKMMFRSKKKQSKKNLRSGTPKFRRAHVSSIKNFSRSTRNKIIYYKNPLIAAKTRLQRLAYMRWFRYNLNNKYSNKLKDTLTKYRKKRYIQWSRTKIKKIRWWKSKWPSFKVRSKIMSFGKTTKSLLQSQNSHSKKLTWNKVRFSKNIPSVKLLKRKLSRFNNARRLKIEGKFKPKRFRQFIRELKRSNLETFSQNLNNWSLLDYKITTTLVKTRKSHSLVEFKKLKKLLKYKIKHFTNTSAAVNSKMNDSIIPQPMPKRKRLLWKLKHKSTYKKLFNLSNNLHYTTSKYPISASLYSYLKYFDRVRDKRKRNNKRKKEVKRSTTNKPSTLYRRPLLHSRARGRKPSVQFTYDLLKYNSMKWTKKGRKKLEGLRTKRKPISMFNKKYETHLKSTLRYTRPSTRRRTIRPRAKKRKLLYKRFTLTNIMKPNTRRRLVRTRFGRARIINNMRLVRIQKNIMTRLRTLSTPRLKSIKRRGSNKGARYLSYGLHGTRMGQDELSFSYSSGSISFNKYIYTSNSSQKLIFNKNSFITKKLLNKDPVIFSIFDSYKSSILSNTTNNKQINLQKTINLNHILSSEVPKSLKDHKINTSHQSLNTVNLDILHIATASDLKDRLFSNMFSSYEIILGLNNPKTRRSRFANVTSIRYDINSMDTYSTIYSDMVAGNFFKNYHSSGNILHDSRLVRLSYISSIMSTKPVKLFPTNFNSKIQDLFTRIKTNNAAQIGPKTPIKLLNSLVSNNHKGNLKVVRNLSKYLNTTLGFIPSPRVRTTNLSPKLLNTYFKERIFKGNKRIKYTTSTSKVRGSLKASYRKKINISTRLTRGSNIILFTKRMFVKLRSIHRRVHRKTLKKHRLVLRRLRKFVRRKIKSRSLKPFFSKRQNLYTRKRLSEGDTKITYLKPRIHVTNNLKLKYNLNVSVQKPKRFHPFRVKQLTNTLTLSSTINQANTNNNDFIKYLTHYNNLLAFLVNPLLLTNLLPYNKDLNIISNLTTNRTLFFLLSKAGFTLSGSKNSINTNLLPHSAFNKTILKPAQLFKSTSRFRHNVTGHAYNNIIRFGENVTGKKILIQLYPFAIQDMPLDFKARYKLWLPRLELQARRLGHKFFMEEALHIIHMSFTQKDALLFTQWLKVIICRISFWKTRMIFKFLRYLFNHYFLTIFPELNVKGLKIKLKGKISVSGCSRKRTILYRVGETSYSTTSLRILRESTTIRTFTGVMGFQIWIFY